VRRALILSALAAQAVVVLLALLDAPFELRLPFGLAYALAVPGFAVVGLLRLADPATELTLSIVSSIMFCTAAAQTLVWLDAYSLAATLAVLAALVVPCLLLQLRARPAHPELDREALWSRSRWS
jgi:hypothetical protein